MSTTGVADISAATMIRGLSNGLMITMVTGIAFIIRRLRWSMRRLPLRASASFSRPFSFILRTMRASPARGITLHE